MDLRRICRTVSGSSVLFTISDVSCNSYYMLVPSSIWQPMIQALDLRQLCSAILDKTIADHDMYQHGKTKIFFRAGMLAALETFRSDRLHAMVTVVQKNVRRRQAMQKYQKLRQSTIKIQTWWRGILARRLAENLRREASAIRLQRGVRCFIQRKRFLDIRQGIVLFQSRMCGR
jgi:myosin-5